MDSFQLDANNSLPALLPQGANIESQMDNDTLDLALDLGFANHLSSSPRFLRNTPSQEDLMYTFSAINLNASSYVSAPPRAGPPKGPEIFLRQEIAEQKLFMERSPQGLAEVQLDGAWRARKIAALERELKAVQQWARDNNSLICHYNMAKKRYERTEMLLSSKSLQLEEIRISCRKREKALEEKIRKKEEELAAKTETLRWMENNVFPPGPHDMPSRF